MKGLLLGGLCFGCDAPAIGIMLSGPEIGRATCGGYFEKGIHTMASKKNGTPTTTPELGPDGAPKRKRGRPPKAKADFSGAVAASRANDPERVERKRFKQKLPVEIGPAEVAKHAAELAAVIREREAVLVRKREVNAKYREQIAYFDERLKELGVSVEQHTETRDVECVEALITRTNTVEVRRLDTGAVLSRRAADAGDVQEKMFDDADGDAGWSDGENPAPEGP